jgi:diguanylate cyclase (GGDEF)-like protein/PAS domain S-box-containing protein
MRIADQQHYVEFLGTQAASAAICVILSIGGAFCWGQKSFGAGGRVVGGLLIMVALTLLVRMVRRAAIKLQSTYAPYKDVVDQANEGIFIADCHSHAIVYGNPAIQSRLGYSREEMLRLTLYEIFSDAQEIIDKAIAQFVGTPLSVGLRHRCKDGRMLEVEVRCSTLEIHRRRVYAFTTRDVSVNKKAEQQLIENQQRLGRIANHDQLTGLPNRHYLAKFLPAAIADAGKSGESLGIVFLDLDRFKHINDTYGHETGDQFLQAVAGRLRQTVRNIDEVIRMGGDEFVIVLRQLTSPEEATQGAQRIVDAFAAPVVVAAHRLQTSASIGISLYPRDGRDMVELLKHSDTAMYQAKDRGRNNVQVFSPVMNQKLKHRVNVESMLRDAIRLKQLEVFYQPFINFATRRVVGLEALIRWRHPTRGLIPPDWFIPVAEETGLVIPLGNFVLHRAMQDMSSWRRAGVALVPMSLNVAPSQLVQGELHLKIAALLKSHELPPQMLMIEMTERGIFESRSVRPGESRRDCIATLRDLGVKIAIDDFGTGYSSLAYLKNWRVDMLKIDRSFVRDLVTDSSDLAIVSAVIAIAKHLQIEVIAEGIEAYQQAEILRQLGCHHGQGYLYARPMAADKCRSLLAAQTADKSDDILACFALAGD